MRCVIRRAASTDAAIYSFPTTLTVITSNHAGKSVIDQVFTCLDSNFYSPPLSVIGFPKNVSAKLGDRIIFECLFAGPNVVVSWTGVNGSDLTDSTRFIRIGSNLMIKSVHSDDEGVYSCRGSHHNSSDVILNSYLTIISNLCNRINLYIYLFVVRPTIISVPEFDDKSARQGTSVRFHCPVLAIPKPTIIWYRNGRELKPIGRVKVYSN